MEMYIILGLASAAVGWLYAEAIPIPRRGTWVTIKYLSVCGLCGLSLGIAFNIAMFLAKKGS